MPQEMRMGREYQNPNNEMLVQKVIALAGQLGGNKSRPELVEMIGKILDTKDPVAFDAIDPDNETNKKRLSPEARDNLRKAWDAVEKGGLKAAA